MINSLCSTGSVLALAGPTPVPAALIRTAKGQAAASGEHGALCALHTVRAHIALHHRVASG